MGHAGRHAVLDLVGRIRQQLSPESEVSMDGNGRDLLLKTSDKMVHACISYLRSDVGRYPKRFENMSIQDQRFGILLDPGYYTSILSRDLTDIGFCHDKIASDLYDTRTSR